jgi:recombination protein RecR
MTHDIEELAAALARLPGIGPRQAKRFVYYLLSVSPTERTRLATLIKDLAQNVHQCADCRRFAETADNLCNYCSDRSIVEKDQDLLAIERAGTYKGRYFVLGGVLTLSGKGVIREKELVKIVEKKMKAGLKEIVLALGATSEGEHTADRVRELLLPFRDTVRISMLGRGLATGSELEYSDADTLRAALRGRQET